MAPYQVGAIKIIINRRRQLKEQTQRIYESCISRGIQLDEQIEDIKSGMSFDRKGFQKLCEMVIRNI